MNKKLTEQQRKEIVISHYLDNTTANIEYMMQYYNISKQGLYNVINSKKAKQYITEYKPNLNKNLDKILDIATKKLENALQKEEIKALDIAKILGIIYDKSRLENNLSTNNSSININIKVEK